MRKGRQAHDPGHGERGVTMILVALAMVAILAIAALSIDVVTLYVAREEAQRSADAAALAAAKVISVSGITGDPTDTQSHWNEICGTSGIATLAAQAVGKQNLVGRTAASSITVTYSAQNNGAVVSNTDCSTLSTTTFGVNPMVTATVTQASFPAFFARIWGTRANSVSATATAEAFNPSFSDTVTGTIIPVQPRCVKPWFVPNLDPLNPATSCTNTCNGFVGPTNGHILRTGISLNGGNASGVIGERFTLVPDCDYSKSITSCVLTHPAPQANSTVARGANPPDLEYLPGETQYTSEAVAGSAGNLYEQAIAGCDETTTYYCGVPYSAPLGTGPNNVDLSEYPVSDTADGVTALINENNSNAVGGQPTGQDYINPSATPYGNPLSYPFEIFSGTQNPRVASDTHIIVSNSIVSLPIYDPSNPIAPIGTSPVTVMGFLQVFINAVDQYGNLDVVVLNVAGCSNGSGPPVGSSPKLGSSPVPVRLITAP
jgi:Flp pilus assembly protein TadG